MYFIDIDIHIEVDPTYYVTYSKNLDKFFKFIINKKGGITLKIQIDWMM
jgi:hypothetical protein